MFSSSLLSGSTTIVLGGGALLTKAGSFLFLRAGFSADMGGEAKGAYTDGSLENALMVKDACGYNLAGRHRVRPGAFSSLIGGVPLGWWGNTGSLEALPRPAPL